MIITKPKTNIYSDGICVYISVAANSDIVSKVALILGDLFVLGVLYLSVIIWIPGLLIFTIMLLALLVRFTLWGFYGKENFIVNTKSISYQHEYGFFKTSYTTKIIKNRLVVDKEVAYTAGILNCSFVTYNENDLPIEIYSMAFPITATNSKYMNGLIAQLYLDKITDDYDFPAISLN